MSARILDDFNDNTKTGWADALNGGTISEAGQRFTITTATSANALTYSTKTTGGSSSVTSESFSNVVGHTLEFRVDVSDITSGNDTNAHAVLGWVPAGGALLTSGYSLVVGVADLQIKKGVGNLFETNFTANIQSTNLTLVIRMTTSGGSVTINARVYRKTGTQVGQTFTVLFEQTVTDLTGIIGTSGNASIGVLNRASGSTSVAFDNLDVFDMNNGTLDNFSVADGLSGWKIFSNSTSAAVIESGGQVSCKVIPVAPFGGFAGAYSVGKTFKIVEGSRLEFRITLVNNVTLDATYASLGYLPSPGAGDANVFNIREYHIASRGGSAGGTPLLTGKNFNAWWGALATVPPTSNCRYSVAMTGEGGGTRVRIETRMEDLGVDVNDPARVIFQNVFVDTPASDLGGENPINAYTNADGNFVFSVFNAGLPALAEVIFDNAEFSETLPVNAAPAIQDISPGDGANFVNAASAVSFSVVDDTNTPIGNIILTLNGVSYSNGSPGVSITGPNQNRLFTLSGALTSNVFYVGTIQASDNVNLTSVLPHQFDTFRTTNGAGVNLVVESEEYNFSADSGATGGSFIDNPVLIAEGGVNPGAYNGQVGLAEVDYHDNAGTFGPGYDPEHTVRTEDAVSTAESGDLTRQKYAAAGGAAGGFFEQKVSDIEDGEWLNYTRTYPAGTYNIYLRQSQYLFPLSLVTLERVIGDRTMPDQATVQLGSFISTSTGAERYRNVPLIDGTGNPVVVRFSGGVDTLRVTQRNTGNSDDEVGILVQNYLVLAPVPDPGTLRPTLSSVSPPANSTVAPNPNINGSPSAPPTFATIANRDTSVNTNTIVLRMNGAVVAKTITPLASGADVSWSLSVLPPTRVITNNLTFQDNQGTNLTFTWTYSYPFLSASNSLPVGSLTTRGFSVRTYQYFNDGANLGNSLARAEQQLAEPPGIPYDIAATNLVQTLDWNNDTAVPKDVPGLDGVPEAPVPLENIATESLGYMHLTAGAHRFNAVSDDGFQLRSGTTLSDPLAVVMGVRDDGTYSGNFDFVVEADGLYPVRCVWYENGGGASFVLRSINLGDSSTVVVNDPADPAGVVKVYTPAVSILLQSSATVNGTYTTEAGAVIDQNAKTITVARSGSVRFYRINATTSKTIVSAVLSGPNIVLTYSP